MFEFIFELIDLFFTFYPKSIDINIVFESVRMGGGYLQDIDIDIDIKIVFENGECKNEKHWH